MANEKKLMKPAVVMSIKRHDEIVAELQSTHQRELETIREERDNLKHTVDHYKTTEKHLKEELDIARNTAIEVKNQVTEAEVKASRLETKLRETVIDKQSVERQRDNAQTNYNNAFQELDKLRKRTFWQRLWNL